MKVKVPHPVIPEVLYAKEIKTELYDKLGLEKLLEKAEEELDNVCEKLKSGKYCIAEYWIWIQDAKSKKFLSNFNVSNGGFSLSVKEGREFSLPDFQRRYKATFKNVLKRFREGSINLYFHVNGFRDEVGTEIETKGPE